jgi:hypothetical protein
MASDLPAISTRREWIFANPWAWLALGGILFLVSCVWSLSDGGAGDFRVLVLAPGLACVSVGIWLRWNDSETVYFSRYSILLGGIIRLAMSAGLALVALGLTCLFAWTLFGSDRTAWKPGATFLVWLSAAPACLFAAQRCWKRRRDRASLGAGDELALALVCAAICCWAGSMVLDRADSSPDRWGTLGMFLRALFAVCLLAAALVLVSVRLRRLVLSLLIVLHLGGIVTACLNSPPNNPLLIQQLWTRIFRPYLEFMYLNNPYRFYAPEPNPASYLWFRLIYDTPEGSQQQGWWYKVPQLDDRGNSLHAVTLEYQRFLPLTAWVSANELPPSLTDVKGNVIDFYKDRLQRQPLDANAAPQVVVGVPKIEGFRIPIDANQQLYYQYLKPTADARMLLSSYSRYVARNFASHPEHADWRLNSMKIYRVVHKIPEQNWLSHDWPANDPVLYQPIYLGKYDAEGNLMENDPFLYWVLPIVRANSYVPASRIWDFARLHAGDAHWVRPVIEEPHTLDDPPAWGLPNDDEKKMVQP